MTDLRRRGGLARLHASFLAPVTPPAPGAIAAAALATLFTADPSRLRWPR